ncbi:hypothetical protein [Paenibacillus sp. OV219]|uniref:hypothetical protein n=1 Tax=Paenibacillus sp. OV219 TaxID=1884377 RepID=UPI0011607F82|nr:hypothetical protein [Paenibacillus sp. OV219]
MNCENHLGKNCPNCKPVMEEMTFSKENVEEIMLTLIDELHHIRRSGYNSNMRTDMRTVITHVAIARRAIKELKEVVQ